MCIPFSLYPQQWLVSLRSHWPASWRNWELWWPFHLLECCLLMMTKLQGSCLQFPSVACTQNQNQIRIQYYQFHTKIKKRKIWRSNREEWSDHLSDMNKSLLWNYCEGFIIYRGCKRKKYTSHENTDLLFSADCKMRAFFSSSSSGRSLATTIPSSWSCKPSGVIMKFNRVTYTHTKKKCQGELTTKHWKRNPQAEIHASGKTYKTSFRENGTEYENKANLDRSLWQVVRVSKLGGHVKLEILWIFNGGVSKLDAHTTTLFERLLQQQRLQDGVKFLTNVF